LTRRRSKLEIYIEVLSIVKNGTSKPTRVMYEANLSWDHLQSVLNPMVKQGLIEEIDTTMERRRRDKRTTRLYELTQKGENVLRYFNDTKAFGIEDVKITW
jgi:predicted transcriptional regulator